MVTGSAKGIGRGIAEEFLNQGANTILVDKDKRALNNTYDTFVKKFGLSQVSSYTADSLNKSDLKIIKDSIKNLIGGINHLVCNVGSGVSVSPLEEDVHEFQRMLDINLLNAVQVVTEFWPLLEKTSEADHLSTITFVGSICGVETLGCPVAYSSAKSALVSYAKNISNPLGKKGLRVNIVSPGNILFSGSTWDRKIKENPKSVTDMINTQVPLQKFGTIKDIANAIVFLASPKASFVNGANWVIDGGQTRS